MAGKANRQQLAGLPSHGIAGHWKCAFYTYVDNQDCHIIHGEPYYQTFVITPDGKKADGSPDIRVSIAKFDRKVSRSTAGTALHVDE